MGGLLVLIPTYEEANNVGPLCAQLLALGLELHVLFVDDDSPDGTGHILDGLAGEHANVHVLHRTGKQGIGSAHATGIRWAYDHGYARLVTMDSDFTHDPRYVPALVTRMAEGADVVVGSRYLQAGSIGTWSRRRRLLTRTGHLLTRQVLRIPYDATNAFRCYALDRIPRRVFDHVTSPGYSFFFESLYVLHRSGFRIVEIPVPLARRNFGSSKMTLHDIVESVRLLLVTWVRATAGAKRFQRERPGSER